MKPGRAASRKIRRSRRRKENPNSRMERHEVKERSLTQTRTRAMKAQRTAALQDLAEEAAGNLSRQRLGVRLSSAALRHRSLAEHKLQNGQPEATELAKAHPLPIRWGEGSRERGSVHWRTDLPKQIEPLPPRHLCGYEFRFSF
jgi:hypothetical protein